MMKGTQDTFAIYQVEAHSAVEASLTGHTIGIGSTRICGTRSKTFSAQSASSRRVCGSSYPSCSAPNAKRRNIGNRNKSNNRNHRKRPRKNLMDRRYNIWKTI